MSQVRLFVGNLPFGTLDHELEQEFGCYGAIKSVELKQKKSPDGNEVLGEFAFVTIQIDDFSLEKCLREFKNEPFKGEFLSVSVARESFLDRLRREREEAGLKDIEPKSTPTKAATVATPSKLPVIQSKSNEESEDSEEESEDEPASKLASGSGIKTTFGSDDEDENEDNLIIKKSSKNSVRNGVIQIPSVSSKVLHIIKTGNEKKVEKQLDKRSKESDQKRIESLEKMKDAHLKQKMAIKAALSSVDSLNSFNKIRFEAAEEEEEPTSVKTASPSKKITKNLFDEDDEEENDYSNDFKIKEQFQGEKGEKLMKLQSRFKNDDRFQMGKHFLDNGEDADAPAVEEVKDDADDERRWQFEILEQVTGKKFQDGPDPERTKAKNAVQMLRYDPTKEEDNKFLLNKKRPPGEELLEPKSAKKQKKDRGENGSTETTVDTGAAVSKDQFFNVTSKLSDSLRNTNEGFSLLSMFGRADDSEEASKNAAYSERALALQNNKKTPFEFNPFKYDSSDSEDESSPRTKDEKPAVTATNEKAKSKKKVWRETFFFIPDDARFKDGALFYEAVESKEEVEEEAIKAKDELRKIIKRKIRKTVSNTMARGITPGQFKKIRKFRRGH